MQVTKNRHKGEPKKTWFKAILLVVLWLLIYSMYRDYRRIGRGFERKRAAGITFEQTMAEKQRLEAEYETVNSLNYREKLIREKLNMQKLDEVVAVLPDGEREDGVVGEPTSANIDPNWKKWLKVVW